MTKMKMRGFQWYLTWRQVAHTSRPPTQELMVSSTRRVQEEDVHGLVRGEDKEYSTDETSGKGEGKGNGCKGEHDSKG